MKTIQDIRNEINIKDLRNNNEYGLSDNDLIDTEFYMIIWKKIQNISEEAQTKEKRKGITLSSSYYFKFNNEEFLNTLRQLYINTNNTFVKKVVKTIGESKKITEKQIEIIINEMMKYNLNINF